MSEKCKFVSNMMCPDFELKEENKDVLIKILMELIKHSDAIVFYCDTIIDLKEYNEIFDDIYDIGLDSIQEDKTFSKFNHNRSTTTLSFIRTVGELMGEDGE